MSKTRKNTKEGSAQDDALVGTEIWSTRSFTSSSRALSKLLAKPEKLQKSLKATGGALSSSAPERGVLGKYLSLRVNQTSCRSKTKLVLIHQEQVLADHGRGLLEWQPLQMARQKAAERAAERRRSSFISSASSISGSLLRKSVKVGSTGPGVASFGGPADVADFPGESNDARARIWQELCFYQFV